MKTLGALLALLCCCLAQLREETISENYITHQDHYGETVSREHEVIRAAEGAEATVTASTQQTCQPDIHTVLREMSAQVAKLEVELRYTKTLMEERLRASERTVEQQTVELRKTQSQLDVMETRLKASEKEVEQLRSENEAQGVNLNLTESQVEELRKEREESRVAFSASVGSSTSEDIGPFSRPTLLIYRHVIANTGNAYNPNTGVFTAPVKGVYHFTVIAHGFGRASTPTGVTLHKNGELVAIAYGHQSSLRVNTSNGASLLLEVGDVVYVKLYGNAWVHDSPNHHTTFSGHLLFLM